MSSKVLLRMGRSCVAKSIKVLHHKGKNPNSSATEKEREEKRKRRKKTKKTPIESESRGKTFGTHGET